MNPLLDFALMSALYSTIDSMAAELPSEAAHIRAV